MIKKLLLYSSLFFLCLILLVYFNYQKQQNNLRQARQTQFSIEFEKVPDIMITSQPAKFSWKVNAPESFNTSSTGIYWSYESTPSALTKFDSPKAVGYPNFTEDYASGLFKLPDTFDLNLKFSRTGVVYVRAFALIDKDYLWTQERQIMIK